MGSPAIKFDEALIRANTPLELRKRRQWVCWKLVKRRGRLTKPPFDPHTGSGASSTDPTTWGAFDDALEACRASKRWNGVGFVFAHNDPYCGIDLDDSYDPETRRLKPWAADFVSRLESYAEISPSGRGVKVFVAAEKPGPRCKTACGDGAVEVYDRKRFFTVTGARLESAPTTIELRQTELESVYQQVFTAKASSNRRCQPVSSTLSDDEIIRRASTRGSGAAKFDALWRGSWEGHFGAQSEADSSLVFTLAFYTKEEIRIDRLFRRSGLMREKWDEHRGTQTYGQITIGRALDQVDGQYAPCRTTSPRAQRAEATNDGEGLVLLGSRDPDTNRLVLSPRKTLPTAQAFVSEFHHHPEGRTLHSYAGTLLVWRNNRFVEIEEETLRQKLQPWLHSALRYVFNKQEGGMELVPFESNPGTIKAAVESIRAFAHLPATHTPPTWLGRAVERPDPLDLLPCKTGNLHIPSGTMLGPTPALFNINALDFDYEPDPEPPVRWIEFVEQLWGDDLDSVWLLQEWMGYCLVADTTLQKMLLLVGPRRSGKGTIGRILTRLVGAGNVVGPTTSSLAGTFGLQPLIGKTLAIVSDARFTGENIGVVVERLLCISGEDTLTVDRKFKGSVTMKLPTRFMFLTNELPRMNDASGALAGRFVVLRLTHSFYTASHK